MAWQQSPCKQPRRSKARQLTKIYKKERVMFFLLVSNTVVVKLTYNTGILAEYFPLETAFFDEPERDSALVYVGF
jgi:hypothetical protein